MGTRHLIAVYVDGQYKVAQYGQWDGYPAGQGKTLLEHLAVLDLETIKERARATVFVSKEEIHRLWVECGASPDSDMVSMDISERFEHRYPELSRNTGGDIIARLATSPPGLQLKNSLGFVWDSLWCEWAYVIDFDKNTFEVYKGFNHEPLDSSERFYSANALVLPDDISKSDGYYAVKFSASWPLNALPTLEELVAKCDPPEEEEE